ncbi:conserved hypothetical protein [Talaromyces stipitatus ATCC 10500]|uniref:Uncharacterized protein n=1 Tax=Talaromyces stipitatus (strain ATCC 10500 / CBS 375.48 / QM 6759 / NRRL 1006) TaxID=441959 RepID=B8LTC0_TALSN|nr:uncharacterized protein TSTA_059920 [Talaromyces stipitatus ATCC 10500]EED22494.1 conserved hypothetical protein [Talaromyces stipitatus ATCC 10500]
MAGALFGSALTASGVYLPSVILSQMELQDLHMLKVFLTAGSASGLAVALYERLVHRQLSRRPPSNLGWIGPYDGNIIGGVMVGFGMALTGACPGTVLVQVGTGVPSGRYAIIGGILGGILYIILAKRLRRAPTGASPQANNSLPAKFGVDPNTALLMFEGMCICLILAARYLVPSQIETFLDPVVGGTLIGAAQLATLILTKSPVGVSTCYEDIGLWFWGCLGCETSSSPTQGVTRRLIPLSKAIAFASGILASSYVLSKAMPEMIIKDALVISPARGILGGAIMVFGARIAGGCTSGHGISGMSMLGISSIITVASMFAGGIGLALAL